RRMPEGIRWSTYFLSPVMTVWPALFPPWERTTMSAVSVRKSIILPLPSSPHWAPTRIVLDMTERDGCKREKRPGHRDGVDGTFADIRRVPRAGERKMCHLARWMEFAGLAAKARPR